MTAAPSSRTPQRRPSDEADRIALTDLLPPPAVPGLPRDRAPLLKQALLHQAARPAPARRARPLLVRFAAPAVACALAVGGVIALDLGETDTGTAPRKGGGVHEAAAPEATRLLDRIALAAASATPPAVRADQFLYVESKVAYAGQSAGGGPATLSPVRTRQVWLSADGSRPGLVRQEGDADSTVVTMGSGDASVTNPTHVYVSSLPTDPDALLALIRKETRGQGQDPDQRAFTAIGELLAETWAPPQVSAALYRAAAKIPGVTVAGTAEDAAGREGVTVARTVHGQQTQWIFDRTTYAYLGERTVLVESTDAGPAGTVTGASAVLTTAAAERAGEAP
ncbi:MULTISPECIES: CU044_5270 family protein [Streptomyces]|uniref:CU044_5270 family protein n=1 Tax=Streptomyces solicathayae TaxID=3081768 RepID=A0ABZ0LWF4_9ACTN|nr:CU044_5270 family protein [Streptomyces sp. HUAS YS2]WOX23776.1 CU044_5270 family protein [Streptomyces sp. HUAS YS2]